MQKGNVFINVTPGCYNYFQSTVLFIGENTVNLLIE